ncbi:hypothetical protein ACH5RR_004275 [Cinchona calisaya]|uniref:KHA domain-containing protein n=1 Tax=Cinchona calisaya TaxID=153742 RepID=A0ABD3AX55_9GENT
MLGKHELVIKLLSDNGAKITFGDVGQFARTVAEHNNLNLQQEIARLGGHVTCPRSNGSTALHVAVCEGNTDIVKLLLQQEKHGVRFLGRFKNEPRILPVPQEGKFPTYDGSWERSHRRRRANNFHNSLFGIMSAAQNGENDLLLSINQAKGATTARIYVARVTISCPEKGEVAGRLILLPPSFQELCEIGFKKYGFWPARVLNKDGAEIDEIGVISDGDHLVFVSDGGSHEQPTQQDTTCADGGLR